MEGCQTEVWDSHLEKAAKILLLRVPESRFLAFSIPKPKDWNNQNSFQSWLSGQTEQSEEKLRDQTHDKDRDHCGWAPGILCADGRLFQKVNHHWSLHQAELHDCVSRKKLLLTDETGGGNHRELIASSVFSFLYKVENIGKIISWFCHSGLLRMFLFIYWRHCLKTFHLWACLCSDWSFL